MIMSLLSVASSVARASKVLTMPIRQYCSLVEPVLARIIPWMWKGFTPKLSCNSDGGVCPESRPKDRGRQLGRAREAEKIYGL